MKNIMLVGTALMLLSTSAFATKARLQSLGEDKDGSYYISDYRNIYLNPAEMNTLGNMAVFEWGNAGTAFGRASLDTDNNTKAEGGAIYGLSNDLKIGLILGDETDVAALTRILASNNTTAGSSQLQMLQTADNVVDLFVAGKGSVNWGVNFLYTSTKDEISAAQMKQHAYAVRLGAYEGPWNAHLLLALGAESEAPGFAAAPKYKGNLGVRFGGGYDLAANSKLFAMYERYSWEQSSNQFGKRDGGFSKAILGFGHTKNMTDKSTLFAKLQGELTTIKLDAITALAQAKITRLAVPVVVGFEHSAFDWLTVRGSIVQNLYGTVKDEGLTANLGTVNLATIASGAATSGQAARYLANARYGSSLSGNGGKKTIANSTTVNAGATLTFGNLAVDGLIGATPASRAGTLNSTANTNQGVLALDNLETRVGVTYKF